MITQKHSLRVNFEKTWSLFEKKILEKSAVLAKMNNIQDGLFKFAVLRADDYRKKCKEQNKETFSFWFINLFIHFPSFSFLQLFNTYKAIAMWGHALARCSHGKVKPLQRGVVFYLQLSHIRISWEYIQFSLSTVSFKHIREVKRFFLVTCDKGLYKARRHGL